MLEAAVLRPPVLWPPCWGGGRASGCRVEGASLVTALSWPPYLVAALLWPPDFVAARFYGCLVVAARFSGRQSCGLQILRADNLVAFRSEGGSSRAVVVRRRSCWSSAIYCCSSTTILKVVDVLFLFVDDLQGRRGRFCCWRCCTRSAISCTKRAE